MPLTLLIALSICALGNAPGRGEPPTTTRVRSLINGGDFISKMGLREYGETAYPAFEEILRDPKSTPHEIGATLGHLGCTKGERGRFLNLAAGHAGHEDAGARFGAVRLLRHIGTPAEGSILVALLGDEDSGVADGAATALAATGGRREVIALTVWLKSGTSRRDDGEHLAHVKKCRDELEKRLKDNPIPKDLRN